MEPSTHNPLTRPGRKPASIRTKLLDITDVAELMNVKPRFIRRLIEERRIPYLKIGKFIRFDPTDLDTWIQDGYVQPSWKP